MVIADETAGGREPDETGLYHNAFRVPTRAPLGDALGRIREYWVLAGSADHGVSKALWLADPEGNGVDFERPQSDPGAEFVAAGGYHHHLGANT